MTEQIRFATIHVLFKVLKFDDDDSDERQCLKEALATDCIPLVTHEFNQFESMRSLEICLKALVQVSILAPQ